VCVVECGKSSNQGDASISAVDGGTTNASDSPIGGSDGGGADASTGSSEAGSVCALPVGDAGASCNTLVNGGRDVVAVAASGTIGTGTGGTIADGLYFLTEYVVNVDAGMTAGDTTKRTLQFCGRTLAFVFDDAGQATGRQNASLTPSGSVLAPKVLCSTKANGDIALPYTATETTVVFYAPGHYSMTFTKQ
jgi:hypothetical protein